MKTALVLGAGGFIGSHMVNRLKSEGYWVRGIDVKEPEFSKTQADEFIRHDLRHSSSIYQLWENNELKFFDEVYQFAADMGGAEYVFTGEHDADIMHNSAQINLHTVRNLVNSGSKVFYSSSACMYPEDLQRFPEIMKKGDGTLGGLKESMAYPASPDSEYGWEKLFSERLYLAYARNYGLDVRIARFHNIYGPEGTYKGGKEKAPAAACRKMITAQCGDEVEIIGDGEQTRSFLYIDDCIDAVRLLMESPYNQPINIGSEEMVSIKTLFSIARELSNVGVNFKYVNGPTGVRGRNSDNTLIKKELKWEPKFSLKEGLALTHAWIKSQYDL